MQEVLRVVGTVPAAVAVAAAVDPVPLAVCTMLRIFAGPRARRHLQRTAAGVSQ